MTNARDKAVDGAANEAGPLGPAVISAPGVSPQGARPLRRAESSLDGGAPFARFTILRDRRESPKKCSIAHLRGFRDVDVRAWERGEPVDAGGCALLHPEGTPLTASDRDRPVLLLDCSWQHVNVLLCDLRGDFVLRSLPSGLTTAYPRRSKLFEDPRAGLATIEALYAASVILGAPRDDILATYREAPAFLAANDPLLRTLGDVNPRQLHSQASIDNFE